MQFVNYCLFLFSFTMPLIILNNYFAALQYLHFILNNFLEFFITVTLSKLLFINNDLKNIDNINTLGSNVLVCLVLSLRIISNYSYS